MLIQAKIDLRPYLSAIGPDTKEPSGDANEAALAKKNLSYYHGITIMHINIINIRTTNFIPTNIL